MYIASYPYPLRPTFKHDKGEINKRRIDQKSLGKSQRQQLANALFSANGVQYSIPIYSLPCLITLQSLGDSPLKELL